MVASMCLLHPLPRLTHGVCGGILFPALSVQGLGKGLKLAHVESQSLVP